VKLRLFVPCLWVLVNSVVFCEDICLGTQFWTADQVFCGCNTTRSVANTVSVISAEYSTVFKQSCDFDRKMESNLTIEQKQVISSLYRNGRKVCNAESRGCKGDTELVSV
jgi:hypothetical protein